MLLFKLSFRLMKNGICCLKQCKKTDNKNMFSCILIPVHLYDQ